MTDPNAPRVFRLRARFIECDRLAMLSHLEVAHTLERTVRRARLPFAVSQGFSPHMKIAFGAALPVGVGSTCEIFDVQLTEYVAPDKALAALRLASVPDLMVQECWYIEAKAKAASVAFPFSTYEVRLSEPVSAIEVPETIAVVRKRKEKVLDVASFLCGPIELNGTLARFTLEAKETGSLRPDVLLEHCAVPAQVVSVTRVEQRETL
ncbi:MAG: DUF2344 domain-containing protein [Eggerthellaceae bacterium]|nr:DUF2344 domain-containing protein [Eggerthellaceae bacterium]